MSTAKSQLPWFESLLEEVRPNLSWVPEHLRPRKERKDSVKNHTWNQASVEYTATIPSTFGTMWRLIMIFQVTHTRYIRRFDKLFVTQTECLSTNNTRHIQPRNRPYRHERLRTIFRPKNVTSTITRNMKGTAYKISRIRIIDTVDTLPPMNPDVAPYNRTNQYRNKRTHRYRPSARFGHRLMYERVQVSTQTVSTKPVIRCSAQRASHTNRYHQTHAELNIGKQKSPLASIKS